jgi:hypothetical protein
MIDSILNFSAITPRASSFETTPHDYEQLAFHIRSDDYFRYLSSLLSFVEDTLASDDRSDEMASIQLAAIRATRQDLHFLDEHFKIIEAAPVGDEPHATLAA